MTAARPVTPPEDWDDLEWGVLELSRSRAVCITCPSTQPVAAAAAETPSDEGLIIPIGRCEGRYRLYGDDVFGELSLIRTLKAMEIPLADGRRILEARRLGVCTCGDLQATIQAKLGEIEQRIVSLQQLGSELQVLLQGWRPCGGQMPLTPPGRPTAPGAQSPSRSVPRRSGPA